MMFSDIDVYVSVPIASTPRVTMGTAVTEGLAIEWLVSELSADGFGGGAKTTHRFVSIRVPFEKRWIGRVFDRSGFLEPVWFAEVLGLDYVSVGDRTTVVRVLRILAAVLNELDGNREVPALDYLSDWIEEGR